MIPVDYDPLIGKLCAWGRTRTEAIQRIRRALHELIVAGITTNIPLHLKILDHPDFIAGNYSTYFLQHKMAELLSKKPNASKLSQEEAASLTALARELKTAPAAFDQNSEWKTAARQEGIRHGLDT